MESKFKLYVVKSYKKGSFIYKSDVLVNASSPEKACELYMSVHSEFLEGATKVEVTDTNLSEPKVLYTERLVKES